MDMRCGGDTRTGSSMLLLSILLCVVSLGEVALSSNQTSPYAVMACSRLVTMHVVADTLWLVVLSRAL